MKPLPLVSLIISNYNGKYFLKECLESLYRQKYPEYEIIVVDAGSTNGAPQMVESHFPKAKLVRVDRRIGIGEAINLGIRHTDGDLIAFDLNNDELFSENWLSILVDVLLSDESIGVVGGTRLIFGTKETIDDAGVVTNAFGYDLKMGRGQSYSEIQKNPRQVSYTTTLLFRKELLNEIGSCDEAFQIYFEDADFCERLRRKGYKVLNVPRATSYHKVSSTLGQQSPKKLYFLRRGRIRFIIKHYSTARMLAALAWWIFIQTGIEALMIIDPIKKAFGNTRFEFVAERGSKHHILSVLRAIRWNIENLKDTISVRLHSFSRT